jgi:hypothetical protein
MTDIVQFGMILLATLLAFVSGHATARRSSGVRLVDKWPHAHIQFDSDMSQEDVLRFLDMTREMVLTGELAKPKKTEDRATELCRSIRPSIVLELREDGLAVISGWIGGRHDSTYRPMPISEAIGELNALVQELQQQAHPSSSDAHAR